MTSRLRSGPRVALLLALSRRLLRRTARNHQRSEAEDNESNSRGAGSVREKSAPSTPVRFRHCASTCSASVSRERRLESAASVEGVDVNTPPSVPLGHADPCKVCSRAFTLGAQVPRVGRNNAGRAQQRQLCPYPCGNSRRSHAAHAFNVPARGVDKPRTCSCSYSKCTPCCP